MKVRISLAALALTALVAAGCGSSSSSSTSSASSSGSSTAAASSSGSKSCTASIAIEGPFTGPVAQVGLEQLHFAQLAVANDNAANHTNVTLAQDDTQLGPGGVLGAGVLFVRVATFGAFQRVALQIQGLIVRRDTGIADSHGAKPFRWYR